MSEPNEPNEPNEIQTCPFCGSDQLRHAEEYAESEEGHLIMCMNCQSRFGSNYSPEHEEDSPYPTELSNEWLDILEGDLEAIEEYQDDPEAIMSVVRAISYGVERARTEERKQFLW